MLRSMFSQTYKTTPISRNVIIRTFKQSSLIHDNMNSTITNPNTTTTTTTTKSNNNISTDKVIDLENQINGVSSKIISNKPWYLRLAEEQKNFKKNNANQNSTSLSSSEIKYPSYYYDNSNTGINSDKANTILNDKIKPLCEYLRDDLGLDNIIIFDNELTHDTFSGHVFTKFIILSTAKSNRHASSCVMKVKRYLKNSQKREEYVDIHVEGDMTSNSRKRIIRRLNRKNNLGSSTNSKNSKGDDGISDWQLIELREENIIINIMTQEKRRNMNLEELYCTKSELSLYSNTSFAEHDADSTGRIQDMQSNLLNVDDLDNVLLRLRKNLAMRNQKRMYSTDTKAIDDARKVTELNALLKVQDFQTIFNEKSGFIALDASGNCTNKSLIPAYLETINKALLNTNFKIEQEKNGRIMMSKDWYKLYNLMWSQLQRNHVDYENYDRLWKLRLEFVQMLSIIEPEHIHKYFIDGYLNLKLLTSGSCTLEMSEVLTVWKNILVIYGGKNNTKSFKYLDEILKIVDDLLFVGRNGAQIHQHIYEIFALSIISCTVIPSPFYPQIIKYVTTRYSNFLIESGISFEDQFFLKTQLNGLILRQLFSQQEKHSFIFKLWESSDVVNGSRNWIEMLEQLNDCEDGKLVHEFISRGFLLELERDLQLLKGSRTEDGCYSFTEEQIQLLDVLKKKLLSKYRQK